MTSAIDLNYLQFSVRFQLMLGCLTGTGSLAWHHFTKVTNFRRNRLFGSVPLTVSPSLYFATLILLAQNSPR
jgi:hypothetical protein